MKNLRLRQTKRQLSCIFGTSETADFSVVFNSARIYISTFHSRYTAYCVRAGEESNYNLEI